MYNFILLYTYSHKTGSKGIYSGKVKFPCVMYVFRYVLTVTK